MRIAQVAPLYESVPPRLYGGTERVVSSLTEELVSIGHDVTLFASGDSKTAARLVPGCGQAIRLDSDRPDPVALHIRMLDMIAREAHCFDLIHFHIDYLHFPLSRALGLRNLTTLHGRLDVAGLETLHRQFRDMPLVSISDAQRKPLAFANWVATIYHGLNPEDFQFRPDPQDFLAFLGRISPEKGVDRAIDIARRVGMPLKIAAKIDPADRAYYEAEIRPLLSSPGIEYIGEIGEKEKTEFLGAARALLFPIDWPEPFGLVMIEAMACGTPVIAFRNGSVPEVIEPGVTGFVVRKMKDAVAAVRKIGEIDRARCRAEFERRFSAERMARDYVAVYHKILKTSSGPRLAASQAC